MTLMGAGQCELRGVVFSGPFGIFITDHLVVRQMEEVFEKDWAQTPSGKKRRRKDEKAERKETRLARAS